MSGHSKWATIKRKTAVIDRMTGKTCAKLARQSDVAARQGGGDPASNAALLTIIQTAKAASMTNDAIDRAIKRATGEAQGANYEAITYEAYAPGGVALLIDI
ncbi:MAG: YebC/PmpR family DNA-binding transcriptional regulator, partial [Actinomycetota bacterium]